MRVVIPAPLVDEIRRHGEVTYPEECCGFLVGRDAPPGDGQPRRILRVARMENQMDRERGRRFIIRPDQLRRFEKSLDGAGELLVGFYHSHPDHPAVPSRFDEEHAWPWYTYLVLAVDQGGAAELGAFELDPDERHFKPVGWAHPSDTLGGR